MEKIIYKKLSKKFSAQKLKKFFDEVLPGKTLDQCQSIINNSSIIIGAYDKNNLIGLNRSLDDGVYAFLTDLIVNPNYRNKGIGTKITKILCQELKKRKIKVIHCSTSKKLIPLFKKINFKYNSEDITMYLKN
jgi:ribosomal protein S18 acetylase RimI-like enzyme